MKNFVLTYKIWIVVVLVISIAAGSYVLLTSKDATFTGDDSWRSYTNEVFGFSLRHPPHTDMTPASPCETGVGGVCSLVFEKDFSVIVIDKEKAQGDSSRLGQAFVDAESLRLGQVEARVLRVGTEANGRNTYYIEQGSLQFSVTQTSRGSAVEKDIEQVIASLSFK